MLRAHSLLMIAPAAQPVGCSLGGLGNAMEGGSMPGVPYLRRLRPAGVSSVRLMSGLVLFTYVGTHLLNYSLGNISLAWLERDLLVQKFLWQDLSGVAPERARPVGLACRRVGSRPAGNWSDRVVG